MGRESLSQRGNWQRETTERAGRPEDAFTICLKTECRRREYEVKGQAIIREFYGIHESGKSHGIKVDTLVTNPRTGRAFAYEMKRQRGEGTAHERLAKWLLPGHVRRLRECLGYPDGHPAQPFTVIAVNGLAAQPRFGREFAIWFEHLHPSTLIRWDDWTDPGPVIDHFEAYVVPLLDGEEWFL